MKIVNSLIVLLSVWFFSSCSGQNSATVLDSKQFSLKLTSSKNITLLDVRTPEEYNSGHVKGSVNVDWSGGQFETIAPSFDKSKTYLIYCRSGHRSGLAAEWLRSNGFKNVFELSGGISAWQSDGFPVE